MKIPGQRIAEAARLLSRITTHFDKQAIALVFIQMGVLQGAPLDISSLAAYMNMSRSSMQRLLEHMQKIGLACPTGDNADRRRVILYLTAAGESAATAHVKYLEQQLLEDRHDRLMRASSHVKLIRKAALTLDQARPAIRRLYEWLHSDLGSIPLDIAGSIYVMEPNFNNMPYSRFTFNGLSSSPRYAENFGGFTMPCYVMTPDSREYYDAMTQHCLAAKNGTTEILQLEVDWAAPGTTFQRIMSYHPRFGLIGSLCWLD